MNKYINKSSRLLSHPDSTARKILSSNQLILFVRSVVAQNGCNALMRYEMKIERWTYTHTHTHIHDSFIPLVWHSARWHFVHAVHKLLPCTRFAYLREKLLELIITLIHGSRLFSPPSLCGNIFHAIYYVQFTFFNKRNQRARLESHVYTK